MNNSDCCFLFVDRFLRPDVHEQLWKGEARFAARKVLRGIQASGTSSSYGSLSEPWGVSGMQLKYPPRGGPI